jgi:hypothetical protein
MQGEAAHIGLSERQRRQLMAALDTTAWPPGRANRSVTQPIDHPIFRRVGRVKSNENVTEGQRITSIPNEPELLSRKLYSSLITHHSSLLLETANHGQLLPR